MAAAAAAELITGTRVCRQKIEQLGERGSIQYRQSNSRIIMERGLETLGRPAETLLHF